MRRLLSLMHRIVDKEIGIDLGTKNIVVYERGRGIIFNEPSVVALKRENGRVMALGAEAKRMIGRSPRSVRVAMPMSEGVIADTSAMEAICHHISRKLLGGSAFRRSRVVVCAPAGSTSLERRALQSAVRAVGPRSLDVFDEPLAAALGANLPVAEPLASMIVDIGGGVTEAAIISLGGIVGYTSVRCGGDKMDETIQHYIRRKHNMLISLAEAEEAKIRVGVAHMDQEQGSVLVRGRNLATGLPDALEVTSAEIYAAIHEQISTIVRTVLEAFEHCPAELSGDLVSRGIHLTGGGSLLRGMDVCLQERVMVPIHVLDDPQTSIARGLAQVLEQSRPV